MTKRTQSTNASKLTAHINLVHQQQRPLAGYTMSGQFTYLPAHKYEAYEAIAHSNTTNHSPTKLTNNSTAKNHPLSISNILLPSTKPLHQDPIVPPTQPTAISPALASQANENVPPASNLRILEEQNAIDVLCMLQNRNKKNEAPKPPSITLAAAGEISKNNQQTNNKKSAEQPQQKTPVIAPKPSTLTLASAREIFKNQLLADGKKIVEQLQKKNPVNAPKLKLRVTNKNVGNPRG